MRKGWMSMVLVAACLAPGLPASAQYLPSPVGAARMPEPIPAGPSTSCPPAPQPNLIPGPVNPQAAPMGPPDCLSLPADHSSAFQCENFVEDCGWYLNIGPAAMQRQRLGAGAIGVIDPIANVPPGSVTTGQLVSPPVGTIVAQRYNDLTPPLTLGLRGTTGILWGNHSIEYSTFYVFQNTQSIVTNYPGVIDTFFNNAPLLAPGNQGMWLQADSITTRFGSNIWSNEVNYRWWDVAVGGLEAFLGVRYVQQNEELSIYTADRNVQSTIPGLFQNPALMGATYNVSTHNNIIAPQVGAEYNARLCSWLSVGGFGKGAWGVNIADMKNSLLVNNQGFIGNVPTLLAVQNPTTNTTTLFSNDFNRTNFGQIYELNAFVDIHILQRLRFRAGYNIVWLAGVATAVDQVDFNLKGRQADRRIGIDTPPTTLLNGNDFLRDLKANQMLDHGNHNTNGSLFYQGPYAELQFFF